MKMDGEGKKMNVKAFIIRLPVINHSNIIYILFYFFLLLLFFFLKNLGSRPHFVRATGGSSNHDTNLHRFEFLD